MRHMAQQQSDENTLDADKRGVTRIEKWSVVSGPFREDLPRHLSLVTHHIFRRGMMRGITFVLFTFLLGGMLLIAACGPGVAGLPTPAAPKPVGDAAAGKQKFLGTCASCHGPEAKGLPGLGKNLTTSTFVKSQSDPQLLAFISRGRPSTDPANTTKVDMPPRGGNPALKDSDLNDIISFIRTINKPQ